MEGFLKKLHAVHNVCQSGSLEALVALIAVATSCGVMISAVGTSRDA